MAVAVKMLTSAILYHIIIVAGVFGQQQQQHVARDDVLLHNLLWDNINIPVVHNNVIDVANVANIDNQSLNNNGVVVYGDCSIDINEDLKDPAPLMTRPSELSFVPTNAQGEISLGNGEFLDMYCEKSFVEPFENYRKLQVQCLQGTYFLVNGTIYPFSTFLCTSWPVSVARRTNRTCNMDTNQLLEIGFQLDDGEFLKTIDICHDEDIKASRYAYYTMSPGNGAHQSGVSRPGFAQGDFYGNMSVNTLYTQVEQKLTINKILGTDASKYFNNNNMYLARGHLAAKADFVFGAAQKATFYFVNVAPQWQTFNGDNWEKVESSVRNYVGKNNLHVECYSGTWGVMTLPDVNGEPKEIYLDFDVNGNGLLPVPMLYYRIVIDRDSQRGIVLIGVNNPHATLEQINSDYILCPDISDRISWVNWDKDNLKGGYSYACSVPDFTAAVHDLPPLAVQGLLGVQEDPSLYKPTFY